MLKRALSSLLLFQLSLFTEQLPQVIDLGKLSSSVFNQYCEEQALHLGYQAFNWAPELTPFFLALKKNYQIDAAVETGTFWGGTSILFSLIFDEVHTIEIVESTYLNSKNRLAKYSNVACHLGSSETVLANLLPTIKDKRVLFYLDAHWYNYWPLLDELEIISKTHKDNCIIVIDDFKVPGRNEIPFDAYNVAECSHEYVQEKLAKVFTEYSVHYLIPKIVNCRAKFIAIPKKWLDDSQS